MLPFTTAERKVIGVGAPNQQQIPLNWAYPPWPNPYNLQAWLTGYVNQIYVQARNATDVRSVIAHSTEILMRRHRIRPGVQGIDWCEVIVACMDGPDPDSGTCWECGSVWRRKPVILYRTDIRSESDPFGPYNLMLHQAAAVVVDCKWLSVPAIAEKIIEALLHV